MAKQLSKLKGFFEGNRRLCRLTDYRPLKTKGDERRVKLMVSMPLSHAPVDGMPDDFMEPYMLMEKEKSKTNFSKVSVILEGALFTIFATDVTPSHAVKVNSATLQDFKLIATGVDEKRTVALDFVVYLPWSTALRNWKDDNLHSDFFAETIPSQMDLQEQPEPEVKEAKVKKPKKGFDPDAIQKAAKRGELVQ